MKNRNKYTIVCGDFNLLNQQNDERVSEFLNIMYSHFSNHLQLNQQK